MENIWYFEHVDLYRILCPHKIEEYSKKHFLNFGKGDFIYMEDDQADQIYMVGKGKVKIVHYTKDGEEVVKAILSKGELFGEKAILGEQKREESAISCSSDTLVCPLNRETMYDLMRKDQRFSLKVYKIIGFRFKKLERRLERLFYKDSKSRVLEFINDMIPEEAVRKGGHYELEHNFTQKDIADLIGAKRETVTKIFNQLRKEGLLDYSRNKIHIADLHWFESQAEF